MEAAKRLKFSKHRIYRALAARPRRIKVRRAKGQLAKFVKYLVDPDTYKPGAWAWKKRQA
jgi:hypothetical protein